MQLSSSVEIWIGALLTIMIFSFLFKDNIFYKFAEHLFVGVSAAYWMVVGFHTTIMPNLIAKIWPSLVVRVLPAAAGNQPEYHYLIPLIFGMLLLTRLIKKISFLSRWAMGLVIGYAAGTNLIRYMQSDFMSQISSTMKPLIVVNEGVFAFGASLSNIVLFFGVICGLVYFFFSSEHKGILLPASRVGIWVLMVTFGASFGYTVMARISLLTGRVQFLLRDWLGIIQ
ncbi:MAG: hypothetical protein KJ970_09815 [Candidatus Eisenbacteria bacterium]|uniref:Uncharacterized protein n=1 Tax=Eiseniibacteriota bacterium TaxID=2212470 RepID=A0A948RX30_UNCEI|nr:hypothetical protein [Candidatus Eisenbacteria bacterium]MBU1947166.1 hypothetical protein [Candidatus Eisenbacteria bacterium]MBU2691214.1 hypothetical protein [Candidatus Eisenbacteria bacterium]